MVCVHTCLFEWVCVSRYGCESLHVSAHHSGCEDLSVCPGECVLVWGTSVWLGCISICVYLCQHRCGCISVCLVVSGCVWVGVYLCVVGHESLGVCLGGVISLEGEYVCAYHHVYLLICLHGVGYESACAWEWV